MRAKKLIMTAFGPYAKQTVIDFDLLGKSGLYIVTGETGAGKTTIFDGICFALYGKASGDKRDGKSLRSKFATDDTPTKVTLVFEYLGREYTVTRNPEYGVLSKRTGKMVDHAPDAELILPDGRVITKVTAVDRAIVELLGVDKGQFNQIAMIAQGDFLKLLLASTEERTQIFRKIFRTEKFEALQNALGEEYNACAAERKELSFRSDEVVSESGYGAECENLSQEERLLFFQDKFAKDKSLHDELKRKGAKASEKLGEINTRLGELNQKHKAKEEADGRERLISKLDAEILSLQREKERADANTEKRDHLRLKIRSEKEREGEYLDRERLKAQVAGLWNEVLQEEKKAKSQEEKSQRLKEERAKNNAFLSAHGDVGDRLHALRLEEERAKSRLEKIAELEKRIEIYEKKRSEAEFLQARSQRALASFREESEKYLCWQEAFLRSQAGVLAERLQDGEPCPVCGSVHHPHPAQKETGVKTEEEIKAQRVLRDQKEEESQKFVNAYTTQNAEANSLGQAIANELSSFSCQTAEDLLVYKKAETSSYEQIQEKKTLTEREKRECDEASRRVREIDGEAETLDGAKRATLEKLGELREKQHRAEGELKKLAALPFPSWDEVKEQVRSWEAEEKALTRAIDDATAALERANQQRSQAEGERNAFLNAALGYSEQDYLKANEEKQELDKQVNELAQRMDDVNTRGKAEKKAIEKLNELSRKLEENKKRFSLLAPLYATASGTVSGKEKLKLETFVQTQYFDRVIRRANRRLYQMTDGQFELIRRENASSKRSQAGLDLDVIDHANGATRPASSLSGGESFMASLALALGLSDEIGSGAGGVKIDSMFVDEGFGSLSDSALSAAIDTLESVSGGNVLVGVISHVDALRERIDKQIVVKKDKDGSRVEIRL